MVYKILFVVIMLGCFIKTSIDFKYVFTCYRKKLYYYDLLSVLFCLFGALLCFGGFVFSILEALGVIVIKG